MSLVLPSIIVIIIVSKVLDKFSKNLYVKSSFWMIRPAVTGLIVTAVYGIFNTALFTDKAGEFYFPVPLVLMCLAFYALMNVKALKKLHPAFWILCGAVIGIIFKL